MKKGAYDLDGKFWFEEDIISFTSGMIRLCFGKEKEDIEIIDAWLKQRNHESN